MAFNKSMVVAMTDIRNALELRFVKWGVFGMGAMGPISTIIMIPGILLLDPSAMDYIGILMPYSSTMLGMFSLIPAAMISANAFVGEREQKTLEPLLATPLTDNEILLGKTLSAFIPSMAILIFGTLATMIGSAVILLAAGLPFLLVPDIPGIILIAASTPALVIAIVALMILISSRVSRVYEAYQISAVAVLVYMFPMIVPTMFIEQSMLIEDIIWITNIITILVSVILMAVLSLVAFRQFNRDRMVSLV
ncbi:MAG: ABC transporter permease subunit [Candidatus Hodarchaeota archaeon]